ncbi:transcriptional regulator [Bacteroidia bacterium]|nr:transcriptional regulator [Bacteroidia bacterium]GHT02678.1 transcriptional regulator [Bacteroidia bacterium]GHT45776.1 transcriptional regulator [Bacteroidia bacterium]
MKQLTAKEEKIMGIFWEKGALFVKQLMEEFEEPKPHYNTLSTFVRSLEEKGYIGYNAYGNTYQYYALVSKEDYHQKTLKNVVAKYFDNSYTRLVSAMIEEEDISIDELQNLIQQVKNQPK